MRKNLFSSWMQKGICMLLMALSIATVDAAGSDNSYIVSVDITGNGYVYIHNIMRFRGTIDWGDGNTDTYTADTDGPRHFYGKAGRYQVVATGTASALRSHDYRGWPGDGGAPGKDIVHIVTVGGDMGITSLDFAFHGQSRLEKIEEDAFINLTGIVSLQSIFAKCKSLGSVPEKLFSAFSSATDFSWAFYGCTSLKSVPEGLFRSCTAAMHFDGLFYGCSALAEIPAGLFRSCRAASTFDATFYECRQLKRIPEGLFDKCPAAESFKNTFRYCSKLLYVPVGLFDKTPNVKYFTYTFGGCKMLMGEVPYTKVKVGGKQKKVHLYERSNYPEHFTVPEDNWRCFYNCLNIKDKKEIGRMGWS